MNKLQSLKELLKCKKSEFFSVHVTGATEYHGQAVSSPALYFGYSESDAWLHDWIS